MIAKVRVIEFDGSETIYDARTQSGARAQWESIDGGIGAVGYSFRDLEGVLILIHPNTVKRIEVYEGDKQVEVLMQRTHKK